MNVFSSLYKSLVTLTHSGGFSTHDNYDNYSKVNGRTRTLQSIPCVTILCHINWNVIQPLKYDRLYDTTFFHFLVCG